MKRWYATMIIHYLKDYYPNKLPLLPIEKAEHIGVL